MNVIKVDFQRSSCGASDENLLMSLQLHDQMLGCLDFVVEKVRQLHQDEIEVTSLMSMIEKIGDERAQVFEKFSAGNKSGSAG